MPPVRPAPHIVAKVQAGIDQGLTYLEITTLTGISEHQIARMRKRGDIIPRKRGAPCPARQRVMPRWIPRDYRVEFFDNVKQWGEDHALRLARRANAEVARAEV